MKSGRLVLDMTCSPSYPSMGKRDRAAQFGLTEDSEESFECNQSFPRALNVPSKQKQSEHFSPDLNKIKKFELNSISFCKRNLINNINSSIIKKKNLNSSINKIRKANYLNDLFNETMSNSSYCYNNNQSTANNNASTTASANTAATFDKSWAFYNQFVSANALLVDDDEQDNEEIEEHTNLRNDNELIAMTNPNKALMVINGRTTEILTANNISCDLFGHNETNLIGKRLKDLLELKECDSDSAKSQNLIECDRLDQNGRVVLCSGKIFDAIVNSNKNDQEQKQTTIKPISMYMLKLTDEQEPRCLCVMEQVQRVTGNFTINLKGRIKTYNSNFSFIFGYTISNQNGTISDCQPATLSSLSASSILIGKDISDLIPSIRLPMSSILPEIRKQSLTGRSCMGDENIPLMVTILNKQLFNNEEIVYNCSVSVYTNISGLVTVRQSDYQINSYNATFSRLFLGYNETELKNKPITYLIHNFFEPSTQSTVPTLLNTSTTNFNTINKQQIKQYYQTPLTANNSYLNIENYNKSPKNQINLNSTGSFLETTTTTKTPSKTQNKINAESAIKIAPVSEYKSNIPSLLITNTDFKLDKTCVNCKSKLKKMLLDQMKKKTAARNQTRDANIYSDFNLSINSNKYSPNKKCINFIESNQFSPNKTMSNAHNSIENAASSISLPGTPQSSAVKKSLLAKAIANSNTINNNNLNSLDDSNLLNCSSTSISSNESSFFDSSSQTTNRGDTSDVSLSFSNLEVSEFEVNNDHYDDDDDDKEKQDEINDDFNQMITEEETNVIKRRKENKILEHEYLIHQFDLNNLDELSLCQNCLISLKQQKEKKAQSGITISNLINNDNNNSQNDSSEVSLIAIDNEEDQYDNNNNEDDEQDNLNNAETITNSNKRKANELTNSNSIQLKNNNLDKNETHALDSNHLNAINDSTSNINHSNRQSLSSTNFATSNNNNNSANSINNKKFKNQVTSTPAALSSMPASVKTNTDTNFVSNNYKIIKVNTNLSSSNTGVTNAFANNCSKISTKASTPSPSSFNLNDGIFFGRGRHADGSMIRIIYQRKLLKLNDKDPTKESNNLICVWISRDPYSDMSIIDQSLDHSQMLNRTNNRLNATNGGYGTNAGEFISSYLNEYEDIRTLGRGASGFVQSARRKVDKFEVVTKYILKSKIYKENWINDERYGIIPLEISILCKLDHPNVIKVLEVFQDQEHVQMVMQKHGCGMDLFEFIDRQRRRIEEPLASYIFRQIISAVSYLHSHQLVHRDIKDENIVINETFQIKLIDFGSAAYYSKNKKFATFCGTIDYCSPDVLLGNKYYGPELDSWTCGIALYTLVFSENPFLDAEETIECILKPPFKVSKELMKLLFSILCPKPEIRASIQEIENNSWVNQPVDISIYKWDEVLRNSVFEANNAGELMDYDNGGLNKSIVKNNPSNNNNQNQVSKTDQDEINDENFMPTDHITNEKKDAFNKIENISNKNKNNLDQQLFVSALLSKSF